MTSRRDALLDIAAAELERHGVEAFGIGILARAAGVRPPSLYKHFEGLADLRAALVDRGMRDFAAGFASVPASVRVIAETYRRQALAAPQHYRLMTDAPIDRDRLDAASELAAMQPLLDLFGETAAHRPRSRSAWAWAHGLAMLEIAGRFPPHADADAAWDVLVTTLEAARPRLASDA